MSAKIINIFSAYNYRDITAANNRIKVYIDVLLSHDYKVNFFTLTQDRTYVEKKDNLTIYYIYQEEIKKTNFLKRAFQEIKISYKLIKRAKGIKANFSLFTIPTIFFLPIGIIRRESKIVDIRDIQWEYLSNDFIKSILKKIMLFSLKFYKYIVVTNNFEYNYFNNFGFSSIIIYNGIEKSKFEKIISLDYKLKNEVTYIGNIGIAQNIMTLVKVAEQLPGIKFNIIGDGAEFHKIQKYIDERDIKNINLTGALQWEKILEYYMNSKILFAQLDSNFKSAIPSKLYEYASTGLPIVYGGEGEAVELLKKLENSYIFSPGDIKKCKEYIIKILNKNIGISLNNRKFIKNNFIREDNAEKLISFIEGEL